MSLHRRLRQPRHRRQPRHFRQFAAALGSLGLASTLAFSGLVSDGIETTEATWNDKEKAAANVQAAWPEAFVSVVAGSARSATSMTNSSSDMTYQSQFRWTSQLTQPAVTPTQETTTGWATRNRIWDQRYQGTGVAVNDFQPTQPPNYLGNLDPTGWALHNGPGVKDFNDGGLVTGPVQTNPSNFRCLVIDESLGNASDRPDCGLGNNFAAAQNTTDAAGFSIGTGATQFTFMNSAHLKTAVRCGINSTTADAPTGRIDFGQETSLALLNDPFLRYSSDARTIWSAGGHGALSGSGFPLANNTLSNMWTVQNIAGISTHAKVMPIISQYASPAEAQPYALSEIAAYIEVYRRAAAGQPIKLHAKMYFVLSRSECGVKRTSDTALPTQRPVFPSELPGGNELESYSGSGFTPAVQQGQPTVMRGLRESEAVTATLPPATTVTSPPEHTVAEDTTTSAPPNPGESTNPTSSPRTTRSSKTQTSTKTSVSTPPSSELTPQPTTSTSTAAPEIVVPRDPGTLGAAARTEDVETITVGDEELDVVVIEGDTIPTDARQGATTLEIWLDGGDPGTTWKTFASDAPDENGWRWAAINQKTGTIVYIR